MFFNKVMTIMMDIRTIRKIIRLMREENIGEIELREGEDSIRINLSNQFQDVSMPKTVTSSNTVPAEPVLPKESTTEITKKKAENQHVITSPMVGTFYAQPAPDAKPFVEVGQHIKAGETLCTIEAMKMFNQIESDRAGKLIACLVHNGQPIEYGQPLFILETE
jgi:acetyl-CoA carboxylase biotin carboxyl carrier protein